jgi:very-short-patch-repair endonuclease
MSHLHDAHSIKKKDLTFTEYVYTHFKRPKCACNQCNAEVSLSCRDVRFNYFADSCPYANRYKNPSCIEFHLFSGLSAQEAVAALRELKSKTAKKYSSDELNQYLSLINSGDMNPSSLKSVMDRNGLTKEDASKFIGQRVAGVKNGFYGKKHKPQTLEKLAKKNADIPRNVSKPELIVWGMLHALGVDFEFQKQVGPYICDFMIDNKILEVYGDFWHSNNKMHPSQKAHDIKKESYLSNNGFHVTVFYESEIVNEPKAIVERIISGFKNQENE